MSFRENAIEFRIAKSSGGGSIQWEWDVANREMWSSSWGDFDRHFIRSDDGCRQRERHGKEE